MKTPDVHSTEQHDSAGSDVPDGVLAKMPRWLRRFGWAGLIFFTAKGIVWLLIFWGATEWVF